MCHFLIGDSPLMDSEKNPVGQMNADSFVENTGDAINEETATTLTLYFANKTGDKLVKEKVNVTGSSNISVEKLVVESLIRGPVSKDTDYPTLPSGTKDLKYLYERWNLLCKPERGFPGAGLQRNRGCHYLFHCGFPDGAVRESVKVQILVNGETNLVYKESMRLDTIL